MPREHDPEALWIIGGDEFSVWPMDLRIALVVLACLAAVAGAAALLVRIVGA